MKKIDLGQAITILANVGVIAGIVFLAVELGQNTQAIRLTASQYMASELAEFNRGWTNPDMARIRLKNDTEGYDSLSPVERMQLLGMDSSYLAIQQNLYYQYRAGSLDPVTWSGRHRQLVKLFTRASFHAVWREYGHGFNDDFRDYIDNVVIPEGIGSKEQ